MNEYNRRSAWIALTLQGYLNIGGSVPYYS